MVSMAAYADSESVTETEINLATTTLQVVGETDFAPVAEGTELLKIEELDQEEFSAFESEGTVQGQTDPLDDVMQEALQKAAEN